MSDDARYVDALLANGRLREEREITSEFVPLHDENDEIIDRLRAERDRLRELFKKYINHVSREEGTTFMPSEYDGFSAEEVAELEALDTEAGTKT
jgi:DNA-directed RNA polymerase specialized sigma24 family protein